MALNGELAYEIPAHNLGSSIRLTSRPQCFLFLERREEEGCALDPISPSEARRYIESSVEPLPPQLGEIASRRNNLIGEVARLPCWIFRYGGSPQQGAEELSRFMSRQRQEVSA